MTKLSGFKPLLNVIIDILKDRIAMPMTAITFDNQIIPRKLRTLGKEKTLLAAKDMKAKIIKMTKEAAHALPTLFM